MTDKLESKTESVKDTLVDIMGYALIGIAIEEKMWHDGVGGIATSDYGLITLGEVFKTFQSKLADYGTHDIWEMRQVTQRIMEKIMRVENLKRGGNGTLLIKKHKVDHDGILPPQKEGDVGHDLVVNQDALVLAAASPVDIPCGLSMKVPDGYFALIINRSSTARKLGLAVVPGVIDSGYTGQLYACVYNLTDKKVKVEKGMRLAQVILLPRIVFPMKFVDELPETERGQTGFGSSGLSV